MNSPNALTTADWFVAAAAGGYPNPADMPHAMLKEIYEQPEAIQTCLAHYLQAAGIQGLGDRLPNVETLQTIHLIASGTSRHASLVGQIWLEQLAGIPTRVRAGSEVMESPWPLAPHTLTIGITQSGETADTLRAIRLEQARYQAEGFPLSLGTAGITNQPSSSLATLVDGVFPTLAGPEIGVAATKTFTTQLVVFYLLALDLAYRRQRLNWATLQHHLQSLQAIPALMQQVLQQAPQIWAGAQQLATAHHCIVLGQGVNRAIALEGALKLKETTYIHAEGYAAGEFMHGPIALLDATVPVIALLPAGPNQQRMLDYIHKARSHDAPVFGIVTADLAPTTQELLTEQWVLPTVAENLSPLLTVLPLQLLAYAIAVLRGLNVDRPRNITKTLA